MPGPAPSPTAPETTPAWPRVKWTRASQVAALAGDLPAVDAVGAMAPAAAFAVLRGVDAGAAVQFVAQCLPRVDAARWLVACLALLHDGADVPPAHAVAAKAVRRWVAAPSDEARRLAYEAGAIAGWDTAEGLAALAVFLSGGSLAPPAQDVPVNPAPGLFGRVAAGAVTAVAHAAGGAARAERLDAMLDMAARIAAGGEAA